MRDSLRSSMLVRTAHTLASILIAACAGAPRDRASVDPAPLLAREPRPAPPPSIEQRPFASTPITEFGTGISDLALAAIWHQPLPTPPIATDRPLGSSAQVVWSERSLPIPH